MSRKKKSTVGKKKTRTKRKSSDVPQPQVRALFDRVVAIMDGARERVVRRVNHEMLIAWWHIGREIVEQVQEGEGRAAYGRQVLKALSKRLTERYGRGFSFTNLKHFRQFYKTYASRRPEVDDMPHAQISAHTPDSIQHEPCAEFESGGPGSIQQAPSAGFGDDSPEPIGHALSDQLGSCDETGQIWQESGGAVVDLEYAVDPAEPFIGFAPGLSWSHYRTLTKVANRAERQFYEIEANAQGWSVRQLERQIDSLLFARLLKSRDKAGVLELSTRGQVIESPVDALKDPYVLDFLDLPDSDALHESDLEAAILHKLRSFLLELGACVTGGVEFSRV